MTGEAHEADDATPRVAEGFDREPILGVAARLRAVTARSRLRSSVVDAPVSPSSARSSSSVPRYWRRVTDGMGAERGSRRAKCDVAVAGGRPPVKGDENVLVASKVTELNSND